MRAKDTGRMLLLFAVGILILCGFAIAEGTNVVSSGECGTNLFYTLNDAGVLYISGTGDMQTSEREVPWEAHRDSIKSVVIESGVTSIGDYAFSEFAALENISMPDSVDSIGKYAFAGCESLADLRLPEAKSIGAGAFSGCSALRSITIPGSVVHLADDAFEGCSTLAVKREDPYDDFAYVEQDDSIRIIGYVGKRTTVVIPERIHGKPVTRVRLGDDMRTDTGVFKYVKKVVLPSTIVKLDDYAFGKFSYLTSIEGLEFVQEIGCDIFLDCANLQEAHFSNRLKSLDGAAFLNAEVRYVSLPDDISVTLSNNPFRLREIEALTLLPGMGVPTIKLVDGAIYSADGKTLISLLPINRDCCYVIPDGTESIAYSAFYQVRYAEEMIFPASLTKIHDGGAKSYLCSCLSGTVLYVYPDSYAQTYFSDAAFSALTIRVIGDSEVTSLQTIVDNIIREVIQDDMTDTEKALALHNWICENGSYDRTLKNDQAGSILRGGAGVCDAYARAYAVLLDAVGIESRREPCWMNGVGHAINSVKLDGEWCYVDCTNDDEGFGNPDLLFGFNDAVFHAYYTGNPSVSAHSLDHYAPLLDERLDSAVNALETHIQEALAAGETSFYVSLEAGEAINEICAHAIASLMESRSWMVNDQMVTISCSVSNVSEFMCHVNNPDALEWTYSSNADGICLTKYCGTKADVIVPAEIEGKRVVALRETFFNNTGIQSVVLPEGLIQIGDQTFSGCRALETVNFPSTLKAIGSNAFLDCPVLQSDVILPEGFESLGDGAFSNCYSLQTIVIPEGGVTLGKYLFVNCQSLCNVKLGEGIEVLPDSVFFGCSSLKRLVLPESLVEIEKSAFVASGIVKLHMPANVRQIHWDAFVDAEHIIGITVDANNPYLAAQDNMIFTRDMKKLLVSTPGIAAELVIPDGVETIGKDAFALNSTIKRVVIPDSVKTIEDEAFIATDVWHVFMGDGVETIGRYAFAAGYTESGHTVNGTYGKQTDGSYYRGHYATAGSLRTLRLSSGLKEIGEGAFIGARFLEKLILPEGLTTINAWIIDYPVKLYVPETVSYIAPQEMAAGNTSGIENVIYGIPGSYAETYARERGYTFIAIGADLQINLDSTTLDLIPMETATLSVVPDVGPEFKIDPEQIIWESSNPDCVAVENGVVTAVSPGTVTITATYQGASASCTVISWTYPEAFSVSMSYSGNFGNNVFRVNDQIQMGMTTTMVSRDADGNTLREGLNLENHVAWSVSDASVLHVEQNGLVTAVGPGRASVIATLPDGKSGSFEFVIGGTAFTYLDIPEAIELELGTAMAIPVEIIPEYRMNEIVWVSADERVVSVDSQGRINALACGTVAVTASIGNESDTVWVTVNKASTVLKDFQVPAIMHIQVGEKYQIKPVLNPVYAVDSFRFESSNSDCAEVDATGLITARTVGTAEITVKAEQSQLTRGAIAIVHSNEQIVLPTSLRMLDSEAFANASVSEVVLPNGIEHIGARAFANCADLRIIHMPDSLESITDDAFSGCEKVTFICTSNNAAAAYAEAHGIHYILLG